MVFYFITRDYQYKSQGELLSVNHDHINEYVDNNGEGVEGGGDSLTFTTNSVESGLHSNSYTSFDNNATRDGEDRLYSSSNSNSSGRCSAEDKEYAMAAMSESQHDLDRRENEDDDDENNIDSGIVMNPLNIVKHHKYAAVAVATGSLENDDSIISNNII